MIIHCGLPASKKSAEVHWRVKLTCRFCKEDEKKLSTLLLRNAWWSSSSLFQINYQSEAAPAVSCMPPLIYTTYLLLHTNTTAVPLTVKSGHYITLSHLLLFLIIMQLRWFSVAFKYFKWISNLLSRNLWWFQFVIRKYKGQIIVCLHPFGCIFVYYWRLEKHLNHSLSILVILALTATDRIQLLLRRLQWLGSTAATTTTTTTREYSTHTNAFSHWDDAICIQGQNTLEGRWQLAHLSVVRLVGRS